MPKLNLGIGLLRQDALVFGSIAMVVAISWFLKRTRAGLVLRAVGESAASAHALGYPVLRIRAVAILFGGAMSGLAGADLSLAYTPLWIEDMVAGRGWIALALVVFGGWQPWRVLFGSYLFGAISILGLFLQGRGAQFIPSQFIAMLPYLATIGVLTLISSGRAGTQLGAPACLGQPFRPAT